MGKGWGNTCEHCPSQGMGMYIVAFVSLTFKIHFNFIYLFYTIRFCVDGKSAFPYKYHT